MGKKTSLVSLRRSRNFLKVCDECPAEPTAFYGYGDDWLCFRCLKHHDSEWAITIRAAESELVRFKRRTKEKKDQDESIFGVSHRLHGY